MTRKKTETMMRMETLLTTWIMIMMTSLQVGNPWVRFFLLSLLR